MSAPKTKADDAEVMSLWRSVGLPEYFLGNGGTNHRLVAFAEAIRAAVPRREKLKPTKQDIMALHDTTMAMLKHPRA